jgi:AcrR family transcriptional regulator
MFKTLSPKGEASRERIRDAALTLFRRDGFDAATMRDIAESAGVALGAAYHYFPSKDGIVLAYYDQVQAQHAARVAAELPAARTLRARLGVAFHTKLDILEPDRKLMGALVRFVGSPDHPLSFLGRSTQRLRDESVAVFAQAIAGEPLPPDVRDIAPLALWALHMGILLYYLYDRTPHQVRTRRLTDRALDVVVRFLAIAKLPVFRPLRRRVLAALVDAGLTIGHAQEAA